MQKADRLTMKQNSHPSGEFSPRSTREAVAALRHPVLSVNCLP